MAEDAGTYIRFAEDCLRAGKLRHAADNYEIALRFEQSSLAALTGLCRVHVRSDDLDEARRVLARAIAIDREHPRVLKLQAEIHARSGRFDLAVQSIHEAAEADLDRRHRKR